MKKKILLVVLILAFPSHAIAGNARNWADNFVNTMCNVAFTAAWPSAEYRSCDSPSVSSHSSGYKIEITLRGRSNVAKGVINLLGGNVKHGTPLWVNFIILLDNNARPRRFYFGEHNAIAVRPGATASLALRALTGRLGSYGRETRRSYPTASYSRVRSRPYYGESSYRSSSSFENRKDSWIVSIGLTGAFVSLEDFTFEESEGLTLYGSNLKPLMAAGIFGRVGWYHRWVYVGGGLRFYNAGLESASEQLTLIAMQLHALVGPQLTFPKVRYLRRFTLFALGEIGFTSFSVSGETIPEGTDTGLSFGFNGGLRWYGKPGWSISAMYFHSRTNAFSANGASVSFDW